MLAWALPVFSLEPRSSGKNMSKIELRTCTTNKEKCLQLKADRSKGSSLKQLDVFINPEIEVYLSGKLTESKSVRSAYLDYDNKRLVVIEMNKSGQLLERVFQIETLAETSYTIR